MQRHTIVKYLFSILLVLTITLAHSQSKEVWTSLALVQTESAFDDLMGMVVKKVTPMKPAQDLNGSEIEVAGFIIALGTKTAQSHFMFSRYPQNMCFFCGAAGPESAMQVFMKDGKKIDLSQEKVKVKGRLQIQTNDASGLIYFLHDAILVSD